MERITELNINPAVNLMSGDNSEAKAPKELLLNEKDMAAYLGISRYFLTELRKKHGLKCLIFEGQHCIYYYLPVVDEFFRTRSRSLQPDTETPDEVPGNTTNQSVEAEKPGRHTNSPTPTKRFPYEPMKAV